MEIRRPKLAGLHQRALQSRLLRSGDVNLDAGTANVRTGNGKLLVLDDKGTLRLVDAEAGEYKELCSATVCEGTLVVPTISNGMVFARDAEKVVGVSFSK